LVEINEQLKQLQPDELYNAYNDPLEQPEGPETESPFPYTTEAVTEYQPAMGYDRDLSQFTFSPEQDQLPIRMDSASDWGLFAIPDQDLDAE
jgi:hypothetical protein